MKKIKTLSILFIVCLLASLIFPMYEIKYMQKAKMK